MLMNTQPSGQTDSSETLRLSLLETQPATDHPNCMAETHAQPKPPLPALAAGANLLCTSTPLSLSVEGPRANRATPTTSRSSDGDARVSTAYQPWSRGLKRGLGGPLSPHRPPSRPRPSPPSPSPPKRGGSPEARTNPSSRKVP